MSSPDQTRAWSKPFWLTKTQARRVPVTLNGVRHTLYLYSYRLHGVSVLEVFDAVPSLVLSPLQASCTQLRHYDRLEYANPVATAILEQFELFAKFLRKLVAKFLVELFDAVGFFCPLVVLDFQNGLERLAVEVKTFDIDIFCLRDISDCCLNSIRFALAAINDPFEDAEVIAKSRPDEVAFVVQTEPVDIEDLRSLIAELFAHVDPVLRSSHPYGIRRTEALPSDHGEPRRLHR